MKDLIQSYVGFSGRLNRQRYWLATIVLFIVQMIAVLIVGKVITGGVGLVAGLDSEAQHRAGWQGLIVGLLFAYPLLAINVKRRHDRDNPGYDAYAWVALDILLFLALGIAGRSVLTTIWQLGLGVFGIYLLVVCGFLRGTVGPNSYGPDPLAGVPRRIPEP